MKTYGYRHKDYDCFYCGTVDRSERAKKAMKKRERAKAKREINDIKREASLSLHYHSMYKSGKE